MQLGPTQCDTLDSLREHRVQRSWGPYYRHSDTGGENAGMRHICANGLCTSVGRGAPGLFHTLVLTTEKGSFSDQKQIRHQSTWFGKPPLNLYLHTCAIKNCTFVDGGLSMNPGERLDFFRRMDLCVWRNCIRLKFSVICYWKLYTVQTQLSRSSDMPFLSQLEVRGNSAAMNTVWINAKLPSGPGEKGNSRSSIILLIRKSK